MTRLENRAFQSVSKTDAPIELSVFEQYSKELEGWQWSELDGVDIVEKRYKCKNFEAAMQLGQLVAELAESYDHHPMLTIEWGRIQVRWWTHTINGVHMNDLVLAAKTERLLTSSGVAP